MRVVVYLVVKPTGQFDVEGKEMVVVIDSKLTHASASAVAARHPGAVVVKTIADKSS